MSGTYALAGSDGYFVMDCALGVPVDADVGTDAPGTDMGCELVFRFA